MRHLKSNYGFSLVEVMVVAGLMTILCLGAAKFILGQSRQISFMEDRLSRISLEQELNQLMNDRTTCAKILGSSVLKIGESSPVKVENELGRVIFDPQVEENIYEHLKITKAEVKNISVKGPQGVGEMEVLMFIERLRAGGGGFTMTPVTARFPVATNNTGQIKSCYPTRSPICGDSILLTTGKLLDPQKDFNNCCPGGGSLGDCITTGMEQTPVGSSIFYICTCE